MAPHDHSHATHSHAAHAADPSFFADLLKTYVPRRECMFEEPTVIWLHAISDAVIALSYFSIPLALVYFVQHRKDLSFSRAFWLFAAFILACGTTHALGVIAIWTTVYRLDGLVKALTAVISAVTAIYLWPLIPRALAVPSPAELKAANDELSGLRDELEERVLARTEELELARSDAELANRKKDEFLAVLSHELRTPLHAILGWTELLKREPSASPRTTKALSTIDRNARAQLQLITDLLDMSRIQAGKLTLERRPVNLREVLEDVLDNLTSVARAKGVTLSLSAASAIPVEGDPVRLEQAIGNLVSNAIKFTPAGGSIAVTLEAAGEQARVLVADDGEGIESGNVERLFEPFAQGDSSSARAHGGLGLGLAIVRSLVELHGGSVTGTSAGRGRGALFEILLPLGAATVAAQPTTAAVPLAPERLEVQALLVDDDADSREIVEQLLESRGVQVRSATSVSEAWAAIEQHEPDIVITDIAMPGLDGFDLLRWIRTKHFNRPTLPVVALSAHASPAAVSEGIAAGFDAYLTKPVDFPELLRAVLRLTSRASVTRGSAPA
jgi:signal transduction histidine kinase/ActR/RegA family two-component response regulator